VLCFAVVFCAVPLLVRLRVSRETRAHPSDAMSGMTTATHRPLALDISHERKVAFAAIGGLAGAVAVYPLDYSKTLLQTQTVAAGTKPQFRGIADVLAHSWRAEGLRGWYRGLSANAIAIMPEKAVKFWVNDTIRAQWDCDVPGKGCPLSAEVLAGGVAGISQAPHVTRPTAAGPQASSRVFTC
jgi:hypothetical protein